MSARKLRQSELTIMLSDGIKFLFLKKILVNRDKTLKNL